MAGFDGSIYAYVGADIADYQAAMDKITTATQRAFETAQDAAVNNSNRLVQRVGQIMAQLANNGESLGKRLGTAFSTGLNLSIGEIQRVAASIGEKIPQPIKNGFNKAISSINNSIKNAFNFDISKAIQSPSKALYELSSMATRTGQNIARTFDNLANSTLTFATRLPAPFRNGFNAIAMSAVSTRDKVRNAFNGLATSLGSTATSQISASWGSMFSNIKAKADSVANTISNSFAGKVLNSVTNVSIRMASTLGAGFSNLSTKAVNSLTGISTKISDLGSKITSTTTKVAALGAAFAVFQGFKAAVVGSVSKAAEFEEKMSNIKALTGASAETMKQFNAAAQKAGADTAFSASEAADAIAELSKAGVDTASILNGGLTGALNLATAGELSLTEAAEVASTALNAFKSDNLSVTDAANQLAGAANASATDVHELKYGLSAVAAVASGVGMSFNDTTNALAVFAQNGLKGSDAGTSLKTMLLNLSPQTDKAAAQMQQLGIITADGANQFYTAEGKLKSFSEISQILQDSLKGLTAEQQQNALKTMFGTDAIRAANIAMKEGAAGADAMQAAISKVSAADVAKEKLNNLKGAVEYLSGSFETLQIKVGTAVLPILTDLVQWLDKLVGKFTESAGLQKFIDSLTALEPALDHILNGTKLTTDQMSKAQDAVSNLTPAIAGLVGVFAFGPALTDLGLLGTGLGIVGKKANSFSSIISNAFTNSGGLIGVLGGKMDGLSAIFANAASTGLSVLGGMTSAMGSIAKLALAVIGPAAILGLVVAGLGLINSQFGSEIDQLLNTVTTKGPQIIQNLVTGITSQIPALIASGADLIAKFANAFTVMFPVLVQAGVDLISSLVQGVGANAGSLVASAIQIIGTFISSIASALPQLLSVGMDFIANVVNGLVQNLPLLLQYAQQLSLIHI